MEEADRHCDVEHHRNQGDTDRTISGEANRRSVIGEVDVLSVVHVDGVVILLMVRREIQSEAKVLATPE